MCGFCSEKICVGGGDRDNHENNTTKSLRVDGFIADLHLGKFGGAKLGFGR